MGSRVTSSLLSFLNHLVDFGLMASLPFGRMHSETRNEESSQRAQEGNEIKAGDECVMYLVIVIVIVVIVVTVVLVAITIVTVVVVVAFALVRLVLVRSGAKVSNLRLVVAVVLLYGELHAFERVLCGRFDILERRLVVHHLVDRVLDLGEHLDVKLGQAVAHYQHLGLLNLLVHCVELVLEEGPVLVFARILDLMDALTNGIPGAILLRANYTGLTLRVCLLRVGNVWGEKLFLHETKIAPP